MTKDIKFLLPLIFLICIKNYSQKIMDINIVTGINHNDLVGDSLKLETNTFFAFKKMEKAAKNDGIILKIVSAHRTFERQNLIWNKKYDKFNEPIFTPSTKAAIGDKDENISIKQMQDIIGVDLTEKIQRISIELFKFAYDFAKKRGVIIADTKFEFGLDKDNELILIDEIFTPDCSRFWLYKNNKIDYNSFDKQFFRDYLTSIKWNNNQIIAVQGS